MGLYIDDILSNNNLTAQVLLDNAVILEGVYNNDNLNFGLTHNFSGESKSLLLNAINTMFNTYINTMTVAKATASEIGNVIQAATDKGSELGESAASALGSINSAGNIYMESAYQAAKRYGGTSISLPTFTLRKYYIALSKNQNILIDIVDDVQQFYPIETNILLNTVRELAHQSYKPSFTFDKDSRGTYTFKYRDNTYTNLLLESLNITLSSERMIASNPSRSQHIWGVVEIALSHSRSSPTSTDLTNYLKGTT